MNTQMRAELVPCEEKKFWFSIDFGLMKHGFDRNGKTAQKWAGNYLDIDFWGSGFSKSHLPLYFHLTSSNRRRFCIKINIPKFALISVP